LLLEYLGSSGGHQYARNSLTTRDSAYLGYKNKSQRNCPSLRHYKPASAGDRFLSVAGLELLVVSHAFDSSVSTNTFSGVLCLVAGGLVGILGGAFILYLKGEKEFWFKAVSIDTHKLLLCISSIPRRLISMSLGKLRLLIHGELVSLCQIQRAEQSAERLREVSSTTVLEFENLVKAQAELKQQQVLYPNQLIEQIEAYNQLALSYETLTDKIEKAWPALSLEARKKLEDLAYQQVEEDFLPKRPLLGCLSEINLWIIAIRSLRKYLGSFRRLVPNYKKARNRLEEARYNFADTVFDIVEKSHPYYKQVLSDTLEELMLGQLTSFSCPNEEIQAVKSEGTRGWLRDLSNKAIREISD
jgi:hypothetical protein